MSFFSETGMRFHLKVVLSFITRYPTLIMNRQSLCKKIHGWWSLGSVRSRKHEVPTKISRAGTGIAAI